MDGGSGDVQREADDPEENENYQNSTNDHGVLSGLNAVSARS
jgi:hypothetical protein